MKEKELQLVSFEQAVALKKLGFDLESLYFYTLMSYIDKKKHPDEIRLKRDSEFGSKDYNKQVLTNYCLICSAPTVALALKWFRDVKSLYGKVYHGFNGSWHANAASTLFANDWKVKNSDGFTHFRTYELAESALLDELINLIEEEK